jgi:hypothetical protein
MTFSGSMPHGPTAQFVRTIVNDLFDDGASLTAHGGRRPELALLVSRVGRKLVMKQRIEEEIEAVRGACGDDTSIAGFYSFGELCPFDQGGECRLHNQTMTMTALAEA